MRSTLTTTLGLALLTACGRSAEDATLAKDSSMWVGRENILAVKQVALQVGPPVSGTLTAERQALVKAEVGGAILEINAEAGQSVARGTLLARIEDGGVRDAYAASQAGLRTAQLNLELATRNVERATALAGAGAIAERELENARFAQSNAEGALADARSRVAQAERQLAKTEVRAPFTGVVSERPANLGDIVASGTALFTVVDPSSLQFEGTVPVEEAGTIKVGTPTILGISGAGSEPVTGRIIRINPAVDPATRQVRVTVAVPNSGGHLLAGLFAEGRIATSERSSVVIPSAAVDRRGLRPFVVRLAHGKVERAEVELGLIDEAKEETEITSGLVAGDTILLGGARGLAPGVTVRVGSPAELTGNR